MRKCAAEDEEQPDQQEGGDSTGVYCIGRVSIAVQSDREIPADETEDGHDLVRVGH